MTRSDRVLLKTLRGEITTPPPLWMMRQAGRYLPEYRALRAEKGGFLDLVYDATAAATVTIQPILRYGFDAAILFSDILVIPHALGQNLWFEQGEGPRLAPRLAEARLEQLSAVPDRLLPIYETVARVRALLPLHRGLLGFAGSPWTVATYMINGAGSRDQAEARLFAYLHPERMADLVAAISQLTVTYLRGQIDAGVDAVQLFESWSGNLSPAQFQRWVIEPNRSIVAALRLSHPSVPIIGFPKGAGAKLLAYVEATQVDAVALDETVDPSWAHANLPKTLPVQGNLDPLVLRAGGVALDDAIDDIVNAFRGRPHIFNLGHGILPDTPLSHVEQMIQRVRGA